MSEKPKNDVAEKPILNHLFFFAVWVVVFMALSVGYGHAVEWFAGLINAMFGIPLGSLTDPYWRFNLINSLIFALVYGSAQSILVRLGFGFWIKGWVWASLLGVLFSNLIRIVLYELHVDEALIQEPYLSVLNVLVYFLRHLPHVWVLRLYVRKPWLYLLVSIPTAYFTWKLSIFGISDSINVITLADGVNAMVLALLMLWFFRDSANQQKAKAT